MIDHRYILEPYKGMNTRYRCPSCQQSDKTFSRYIDTETGEHIHPTVGRCNRESNCGYHYTPKQYFQDNNLSFNTPQLKTYMPLFSGYTGRGSKSTYIPPISFFERKGTKNTISEAFSTAHKPTPKVIGAVTPQQQPVSYIPVEVFKASLKAHETNHFVKFIFELFGLEVASQLVNRYFIGTSKHWNGSTVFWQIDTQGNVRTGKIILYNPTTGKRVKNLKPPVYWAHKALKQPEFELKQCLFGEHLLIDKTKPIAIVESEKTAIIASVYLPQFIWLAVGGLDNLNVVENCSILKGRIVILFPDLNGFEKWNNKAKELSHLAIITVSDLLERKTNEAERKQGLDLADYLIKFNYKDFALPEPESTERPPAAQSLVGVTAFEQPEPVSHFNKPEQPKSESWEQDITELEKYFEGIEIPTQPIRLNPYSTVTNVSLFIESHFATLKANNGKRTFLPFLNRLKELKQVLTTNSN